MGKKKIKAILVQGEREIEIFSPKEFAKISKRQFGLLDESFLRAGLEEYGTNLVMDMVNVCGGLPTRNWQTGVCEFIDQINGQALKERVLVKEKGCFACPIKCARVTKIKTGPYRGKEGEGPEYETVATFGAMCGVSDLEAITMAGYLCNDYGLDTISAGSTIAFAMECYQRGILKSKREIKFGDPEVIIELLEKIAKREEIGNLLAEGTKRIAKILGKNSKDFALQVKGLELPAYDSRAAKITGLAFVTANRGGDHITAYVQGPTFLATPFLVIEESQIEDPLIENPKEAKVVKELEDALAVFDSAGCCKFMGMALDSGEWSELIAKATGWDFGIGDFKKCGERIYNLERAFNIREGLRRKDDTLPKRLIKEPLPEGPAQGQVNQLEDLLSSYYQFRGWDQDGKPTRKKLIELDLEEVADEIC
jgi:aldehyde:ferredoxin oxidoreductase